MDDPTEARFVLEQIGAECQNGEHGPLALMMPNYAVLYQKMIEARGQVAERDALKQMEQDDPFSMTGAV
ncbi:MAG: hypothetical protein ACYS1E_09145 [Planctomycetota bacterium]|jgi:hypothetical protein